MRKLVQAEVPGWSFVGGEGNLHHPPAGLVNLHNHCPSSGAACNLARTSSGVCTQLQPAAAPLWREAHEGQVEQCLISM